MKLHFITCLIICLVSRGIGLHGQAFADDAQLWLNTVLEKQINDRFSAQFTLQNRITNNVTEYGQGTADLGLVYKLSKHIRFSGHYRFRERRRLDGFYSQRHQGYVAFMLRRKYKRFLFTYRNRLQMQVNDMGRSETGGTPVLHNRNKIMLRYDLSKRLDLYVAAELYTPLYRMNEIGFDRGRSLAGAVYKLSASSSLEGFFMFQRELYRERQLRRDFIYGLTYHFTF